MREKGVAIWNDRRPKVLNLEDVKTLKEIPVYSHDMEHEAGDTGCRSQAEGRRTRMEMESYNFV